MRHVNTTRKGMAILCLIALTGTWCLAQREGAKPRAKPKKFSEAETSPVFFDDVFSVLVGSRPNMAAAGNGDLAGSSSTGGSSSPPDGGGAATVSGWKATISAATIENEIKGMKQLLDQDVTTPTDFKGRGYKACRTHFSVAAMMFAIINEYDGDVRWKDDAAAARDAFARTAANAKVSTTQVYNEAKQRKIEIEDLIRGNPYPGKAQNVENDWSSICDRAPLMVRLQAAFDGVVRKATASQSEFEANKEVLAREAEIIAAVAVVLCKEGMEDGDDDTYAGFAKQMKAGARDIVDGVKSNDYEKARQAVGSIDKACSNCHESYRG